MFCENHFYMSLKYFKFFVQSKKVNTNYQGGALYTAYASNGAILVDSGPTVETSRQPLQLWVHMTTEIRKWMEF